LQARITESPRNAVCRALGPENFQLAHLACNLAKNNAAVAQFQEWLNVAAARSNAPAVEPDIA
jgi:hypothetical protein